MKTKTIKKENLDSYRNQILEFVNKITDYTISCENKKYNKQKILNILSKAVEENKNKIYINFFNDIYDFCLEDYSEVLFKIIKSKTIKTFDKRIDLIEFYKSYTEDLLSSMLNLYSTTLFSNFLIDLKFNSLKINVYSKISQVLSPVYRSDRDVKPKQLYEESLVKKIKGQGEKIADYIVNIDSFSQIEGDILIKPTIKVMDLCRKLPVFISDSEEEFKELIDLLYCAFWDNKAKINDVLPNKPFSFINDLRKYYRHDLEHGDEKNVKKKYSIVKKFFKEACGKSYPDNSKEWQKVQNYIYKLIIEILNKTELEIKNI